MEERDLHWIRFADNINIYTDSQESATELFHEINNKLRNTFSLAINVKKSGVYDVFSRRLLGYDFQMTQNGILNKKDYAILFENESERHYIPVEVVDQLNLYNEVTLTSNVLKTASEKKIRIAFFDKYGNLLGSFVPESYLGSAETVLGQCSLYLTEAERLKLARQFEIAFLHNLRANLRYYNKKHTGELKEYISELSSCITKINEAPSVENLLLIEARARQRYYESFNLITDHTNTIKGTSNVYNSRI